MPVGLAGGGPRGRPQGGAPGVASTLPACIFCGGVEHWLCVNVPAVSPLPLTGRRAPRRRALHVLHVLHTLLANKSPLQALQISAHYSTPTQAKKGPCARYSAGACASSRAIACALLHTGARYSAPTRAKKRTRARYSARNRASPRAIARVGVQKRAHPCAIAREIAHACAL